MNKENLNENDENELNFILFNKLINNVDNFNDNDNNNKNINDKENFN
jgi:hypothetical protein